jgi:hypothetical protein
MKNLKIVLYAVIPAIVLILLGLSFMPSKLKIEENTIKFSGIFGVEIPIENIEDVQLLDSIPTYSKVMGMNAGRYNKGTFNVGKWGRCKLIFQSRKPPFLLIKHKKHKKLLVNYSDKKETEAVYSKIREELKRH